MSVCVTFQKVLSVVEPVCMLAWSRGTVISVTAIQANRSNRCRLEQHEWREVVPDSVGAEG